LGVCTTHVSDFRVSRSLHGRRDIVFVDTPGFTDEANSDDRVLDDLTNWLKKK
jgi:GTPase Era involved in 16S rRNA processing